MIETIARPKIRDVVAAQLRSYIAAENLRPGDRLPTESKLAARFGVSRLSLREATTTLEFLGVLESKPGRGLTVGNVDFTRVAKYLEFHPSLSDSDPIELIRTRTVIETGVAPYVSQHMQEDASVYEKLNEINNALRKSSSLKRWIELDIAFHRLLVESSGLSSLVTYSDLLAVFFRRFRESVKEAEWQAGVEGHQRIIDALRDGDEENARRELRQHIEHHETRLTGNK